MADFQYLIQWWLPILIIGMIFYPLSSRIFHDFYDKGYLFSKVLGLGIIAYVVFVLNTFRILPLNLVSIFIVMAIFAVVNIAILRRQKVVEKINWKAILFEEILFFAGLTFWSYVRGHEPSINGLEKFMDFGFLNSILRSEYMPARDMWFTNSSINYYYFGHFTTAILTKLSQIPSNITFNLMVATLFSFTLVLSFSLGSYLMSRQRLTRVGFVSGLIASALITFGANLHAIYSLFKPYNVESPVAFWNLPLLLNSFPNGYWYPNATRFIPLTIHEFPIYSFVVSDLHGHVLDLVNVFLILALAFTLYVQKNITKITLLLIPLFLSIMYMTNAWDAGIYMFLILTVIILKNWQEIKMQSRKLSIAATIVGLLKRSIKSFMIVVIFFILFSIPFNINFSPSGLTRGIGLICAPKFLTDIGSIGPFLFEANHCQKSPFWQIFILYGFFYFFVISFIAFLLKMKDKSKILKTDYFVIVLIGLSTALILIPEIIYLKDIYPAHYRANTMFKLVYQAFIMLSFVSAYVLVRIINQTKNLIFYTACVLLLLPVLIYPYFAIKSYYGELKKYTGIDGTLYLKTRYPEDYAAINWINTNIKGQPVIVESQGDSYTDFARISSNTGLPTILGWTVHEWLWRGSYDVPAPRIDEIKNIYESKDLNLTRKILKKYKAEYVYVGNMEYEKYPNILESKFITLGEIVYENGKTKIYKITY